MRYKINIFTLVLLLISVVSIIHILSYDNFIVRAELVPTAEPLQNYSKNISTLGDILNAGKNVLFSFVGLAAVAYTAYAGYTWLTSLGDPEKIKKAQSMVIYGFIGLVVIAFSFLIIQLVSRIIGVNITNFTGSSNTPTVSIFPRAALPGDNIKVTGYGFKPNIQINITDDSALAHQYTCNTDDKGKIVEGCNISIDPNIPSANYGTTTTATIDAADGSDFVRFTIEILPK